jgi:flagellar hook-basal body complex protein FliE
MQMNRIQHLQSVAEQMKITSEGKKEEKNSLSFSEVMKDQLSKLNESQVKAEQMTEAFIKGEVEDLHAVMIATEEARISLDLALVVRNKLVEAYKEVNNMQL